MAAVNFLFVHLENPDRRLIGSDAHSSDWQQQGVCVFFRDTMSGAGTGISIVHGRDFWYWWEIAESLAARADQFFAAWQTSGIHMEPLQTPVIVLQVHGNILMVVERCSLHVLQLQRS